MTNFFNLDVLVRAVASPEQIRKAIKHGEKVETQDSSYVLTSYFYQGKVYVTGFEKIIN